MYTRSLKTRDISALLTRAGQGLELVRDVLEVDSDEVRYERGQYSAGTAVHDEHDSLPKTGAVPLRAAYREGDKMQNVRHGFSLDHCSAP